MKLETVGFLETNSIAIGIKAADIALKTANVKLHFARPNCPGKYNILISGEIAAVQASIDAGAKVADYTLIEKLVIPRIHPQVVQAINMSATDAEINAIGILEYFNITSALLGADSAVKSADISLIDVRLGTGVGGKSYVILTGDTSAVSHGVECGAKDAIENGMLIAKVVISNPTPALFENLL